MLNFVIDHSHTKGASTKQYVLQILLSEFPLNISQLRDRLRELHKVKLSYQAVRKAVLVLQQAKILIADEKFYKINKRWLLDSKRAIDSVLAKYASTESVTGVIRSVNRGEQATYLAHSLYEADNLWTDIFLQCCEALPPRSRNILCSSSYAWYMIINLGHETALFNKVKKQKIKTEMYLWRDLPLNRWASKLYREVGTLAIVSEKTEADDSLAFNVIGSMIIQVELPPGAVKQIRSVFMKYRTLKDIPSKELAKLEHAKHTIRLSVFKNSALARELVRQARQ